MKRQIGLPKELLLGVERSKRVPWPDQKRQRAEVAEIVRRLHRQPGMILADEVGMGKTFVALAVAYTYGVRAGGGPVVVMVPANLVDKWVQDLGTFCDLYLERLRPIDRTRATPQSLRSSDVVRYGVARDSVDFLKLLDDPADIRAQLIFLAHGAMGRRQTDKWVRLALIAKAFERHATGRARRLIQVRKNIHRFLGELLQAVGEERAHGWGAELWVELLSAEPSDWRRIYNREIRGGRTPLSDDPVPIAVVRALTELDIRPLVAALEEMPVRESTDRERTSARVKAARAARGHVGRSPCKALPP